jgi:hypothetical protein
MLIKVAPFFLRGQRLGANRAVFVSPYLVNLELNIITIEQ